MKTSLLITFLSLFWSLSAFPQWVSEGLFPEKLLDRTYYQVGWSESLGRPVWVGYKLYRSLRQGTESRLSTFKTDPEVPEITSSLYVGSGYDRGHMCPAADFKGTPEGMAETFLLTNVCPQEPSLNRGQWKVIEETLRKLVDKSVADTVYIIAGTLGYLGVLKGKITIPKTLWKTAVGVKSGKVVYQGYWQFSNTKSPSVTEVSRWRLEALLGRDLYPGFWFRSRLRE